MSSSDELDQLTRRKLRSDKPATQPEVVFVGKNEHEKEVAYAKVTQAKPT